MTPRRLLLVGSAVILAATFLAFGRSLWQGFSPSDDVFLVVTNIAAHGFSRESLRLAFTTYDPELYIPLTLVSFQFNYALSGLQPFGYHLLNILLHAGNAMLVALIVARLTKRKALALLAGLVFAVHPLHTEAVAWIAGRKDVLSGFFALLSLLMYILYRQRESDETEDSEESDEHDPEAYVAPVPIPPPQAGDLEGEMSLVPRNHWIPWILRFPQDLRALFFLATIIFLVLSLLSKLTAVTLPLVFLLYDLLWERRPLQRSLLDKIPFALLALLFSAIAAGGKERIIGMLRPWETILVACKSIAFYLEKFLAPANLSILYPQVTPVSLARAEFFVPVIVVALLLASIAWTWRKQPRIAFALLFFLVTLSPTLVHAHKGDGIFFAVDRYAYLPSVGLLLVGVLLLARFLEDRQLSREATVIPAAIALAILILLAIRQTRTWDSADALYGNVLRIYPASADARAALGSVLRQRGQIAEAFDVLREGLRYGDVPSLHFQAGYVYAANGDTASAREQFEKVRRMQPQNPEPLVALAELDAQTGQTADIKDLYMAAVQMDPSYVAARVALARILAGEGDVQHAMEQLRTAIRWNPSDVAAQLLLAQLLKKQGKTAEARQHAASALLAEPGNGEATKILTALANNGAIEN